MLDNLFLPPCIPFPSPIHHLHYTWGSFSPLLSSSANDGKREILIKYNVEIGAKFTNRADFLAKLGLFPILRNNREEAQREIDGEEGPSLPRPFLPIYLSLLSIDKGTLKKFCFDLLPGQLLGFQRIEWVLVDNGVSHNVADALL